MHVQTRRHSALMLLLVPIFAIGSSALVAGTAASAGATAKKAINPTVKICEVAPGAFRFALNGSVVSFKGSCGVFTAKIGVNHVSEVSAPAMYRSVSSISVSPATAKVSSSLKTATVAVRLAAGKSATVKFANSKLVVVVPSPTPVSPTPSSPPVSNPDPSSPPPSSPPVSNPDPVSTSTGTGYIEVCKSAADAFVEGSFSFAITAGSTSLGTYSVAVGSCTGAITAPAGTVTVTEAAEGPGYSLVSVTAAPTTALGTVDLATQTANFTVTAGYETTGDFTNATNVNLIKVCKVLTNNEGNLAGTEFYFDVSWVFTPANGATPITWTGGEVGVVAVAAPGQACTVVTNSAFYKPAFNTSWWPLGIPVGAVVTVNEALPSNPNTPPYVQVTGASVVPSTFDAGSSGTTALVSVPPVADGYADAVFTNDPMGYVEVCKQFIGPSEPLTMSSSYNEYNSASFTVNGGAPFTLQGGTCSAPIEVPAGTATITENLGVNPNFYLDNVTATNVLALPGSELQSGSAVNPAVVGVPYGSPGDETLVTFYDEVDGTAWKICANETSSDVNLAGQTVYFTWMGADSVATVDPNVYSDGGIFPSITFPATYTGGTYCTGVFYGPPVVDPMGNTYSLKIKEFHVTGSGVYVTAISYLGNGSATAPAPTLPAIPAWITVTAGAGMNTVTFTNGSEG